jgi:hypothetical protein
MKGASKVIKLPNRRRKFMVGFCVEVEVDQAVFDAVLTDEWRSQFYPFYTPADVAGNLAFCLVQGMSISQLDGYADQDKESAKIGPIENEDVDEIEPKPTRPRPKKLANDQRSKKR